MTHPLYLMRLGILLDVEDFMRVYDIDDGPRAAHFL